MGVYSGWATFGPGQLRLGFTAGYNLVSGNFLYGMELTAGATNIPPFAADIDARARAGFIVSDNVLLYAMGSVGYVFTVNVPVWNLGGGAELATGRLLSLFVEASVMGNFQGFCCTTRITIGGRHKSSYEQLSGRILRATQRAEN